MSTDIKPKRVSTTQVRSASFDVDSLSSGWNRQCIRPDNKTDGDRPR